MNNLTADLGDECTRLANENKKLQDTIKEQTAIINSVQEWVDKYLTAGDNFGDCARQINRRIAKKET